MRLVLNATLYLKGIALKPEILKAIVIADQLHAFYTGREVEITSTLDGKHSKGSRHYSGLAFDIRNWYLTEESAIEDFIRDLRIKVENDYDIVRERTHIHVEFDPERLS